MYVSILAQDNHPQVKEAKRVCVKQFNIIYTFNKYNILLWFLQWIRLISSKSYWNFLCLLCCHQMKLSFYFTLQRQNTFTLHT